MDQIESNNHSFIIRVWREDHSRPMWRGYITHVPSGEQRYLQELQNIVDFIEPYLEKMGIQSEK